MLTSSIMVSLSQYIYACQSSCSILYLNLYNVTWQYLKKRKQIKFYILNISNFYVNDISVKLKYWRKNSSQANP